METHVHTKSRAQLFIAALFTRIKIKTTQTSINWWMNNHEVAFLLPATKRITQWCTLRWGWTSRISITWDKRNNAVMHATMKTNRETVMLRERSQTPGPQRQDSFDRWSQSHKDGKYMSGCLGLRTSMGFLWGWQECSGINQRWQLQGHVTLWKSAELYTSKGYILSYVFVFF